MFSESALKNLKSLKLHCSALNTTGTATQVATCTVFGPYCLLRSDHELVHYQPRDLFVRIFCQRLLQVKTERTCCSSHGNTSHEDKRNAKASIFFLLGHFQSTQKIDGTDICEPDELTGWRQLNAKAVPKMAYSLKDMQTQ